MLHDAQAEPGSAGGDRTGGQDRIAEELRSLARALAQRLEESLLSLGCETHRRDQTGEGRDGGERSNTGALGCPLCALLGVVHEWPLYSTRMLDQVVSLLSTLRGLLAEHSPDGPADTEGANSVADDGEHDSADTVSSNPATETKVQHIEVRRVRGSVRPDNTGTTVRNLDRQWWEGMDTDTEASRASC